MADNLPITGSTEKVATKEIAPGVHAGLQSLVDQTGVDAIGAVAASPSPLTLLGRLKAAVDALVLIQGYSDGIETLIGSTNTALATSNATLTAIAGFVDGIEAVTAATNALLGGTLNVAPQLASGGNLSVTTNTTGTTYNPIAGQACKQVTIINDTGTKLQVRQGATGDTVTIFDQAAFTFFGITNANQLQVRRKDTSNTAVTADIRWEA